MPRITELYAYVMADTGPDDEGVPSSRSGGADMERAEQLREQAVFFAKAAGKPITLIRSTGIEVVEVIEP